MLKSVRLLLRHKEEKGIDFRTLAEKTGKSHAYWWILLVRDKRTPTIQNALEFAQAVNLDKKEKDIVLNLVLKERCLEHLKKQGFTKINPTEEIRNLIEALKSWKPEKGGPPRYIMSTLTDGGGTEFAKDFKDLGEELMGDLPRFLKQKVREENFQPGLGLVQGDFSKDYA